MSEGRFAVTFDDGYAAVGRIAWPLLLELQVPMTLFVVAGAIGQSNHWDQAQGDCLEPMADAVLLRELADAGVEIGSHTMSHARLTACSNAELHTEIVDAKQKLEDLLGRPVPGFSYPYGAWDARVRAAVIDAGYRYATATILGPVATDTDPYLIPRVNMRWNTVGWLLQRKIRKAYRQGGA